MLLVEASDADTNPLIAMPGGFGELLGDPTTAWHYPTRPFGPSQQVEYWLRGKTLGNPGWGWGWDEMLPVFSGYHTIGTPAGFGC